MERNKLNFYIDLISLIIFLAIIFTGLLIYYVLPPCNSCSPKGCNIKAESGCGDCNKTDCSIASKPKGEANLWGYSRHDIGTLHFKLSIVLTFLMLIHTIMHWTWICATISNMLGLNTKSHSRNNLYGIILFILIIALLLGSLYWLKAQTQY